MHKLLRLVLPILLLSVSVSTAAKIIKEERSLYRNIFVEDKENVRCLKFSVKRQSSNQSCIYIDDEYKLVFDYTKFIMSTLVFKPDPQRVLIIGLGGGTLSNSLLHMYPNIEIDNVEIDPAVVKVAVDYFNFKQTDKVKSHVKDGRIFIKRALKKQPRYDFIILDAFNGEYIPEHLLTAEFLQESQQLLTDDGILVANTFSSSDLYHHESATYHHVFGDFYTLVNRRLNGNRIIVIDNSTLSDAQFEQNKKSLARKLSEFDIDLEGVLATLKLEEKHVSDYKILTDQYSPANLL